MTPDDASHGLLRRAVVAFVTTLLALGLWLSFALADCKEGCAPSSTAAAPPQ